METTPHNAEQKTIRADTLAAISKTHPIEAAIWTNRIASGRARVIAG